MPLIATDLYICCSKLLRCSVVSSPCYWLLLLLLLLQLLLLRCFSFVSRGHRWHHLDTVRTTALGTSKLHRRNIIQRKTNTTSRSVDPVHGLCALCTLLMQTHFICTSTVHSCTVTVHIFPTNSNGNNMPISPLSSETTTTTAYPDFLITTTISTKCAI